MRFALKFIILTAVAVTLIVLGYLLVKVAIAQDSITTAEHTETATTTQVFSPDVLCLSNGAEAAAGEGKVKIVLTSEIWDGTPYATSSTRTGTARTESSTSSDISAFLGASYLDVQGNIREAILKAHKAKGDAPSDLVIEDNMEQLQ